MCKYVIIAIWVTPHKIQQVFCFLAVISLALLLNRVEGMDSRYLNDLKLVFCCYSEYIHACEQTDETNAHWQLCDSTRNQQQCIHNDTAAIQERLD